MDPPIAHPQEQHSIDGHVMDEDPDSPIHDDEQLDVADSEDVGNVDESSIMDASAQQTPQSASKEDKHGVDHRLDQRVRLEIVRRLLDKYWKPDGIARDLNVSIKTVYRIKNNLIKYGSAVPPREKTLGRPKGLTKEDEDYLLERLTRQPDLNLRQLSTAMKEERNITVSRSTLSRVLTARRGPSATALAMKERKPRKSSNVNDPELTDLPGQQPLPEPMTAQMTAPPPPDINPNIDSSLLDVPVDGGSFASHDFQQHQFAQLQQHHHLPPSNMAPQQHNPSASVGSSGLIG